MLLNKLSTYSSVHSGCWAEEKGTSQEGNGEIRSKMRRPQTVYHGKGLSTKKLHVMLVRAARMSVEAKIKKQHHQNQNRRKRKPDELSR